MKKFKVLTILLFVLIVANIIIDKSAILLPPNANFIEYFAKRVPVYCRIEPKDDITELPLINVGDAQIENLSSQADLSVITEYTGVSMLWLKKTAENRHEANEMLLATILFIFGGTVISGFIGIYILILSCAEDSKDNYMKC